MKWLNVVYLLWVLALVLLVHRWSYQAGVDAGTLAVYRGFAETGAEGYCYAENHIGGCNDELSSVPKGKGHAQPQAKKKP